MGSIRKMSAQSTNPAGALPFHDAPPLSPATGAAENAQAARAMADAVMSFAPATDADMLKVLRAAFPDSPLGLRVAALALLNRRRPRGQGTFPGLR